ncbi:MAG: hypothetical protein IJ305_07030 [Oscillospiraceae bacterium]|nr:hypothetical protein [Oscillospiraceae bacterium]
MDFFRLLRTSTPKAHRTPLSIGFIIAIAVTLAVFYFSSKFLEERFPNLDSETRGVIVKIISAAVLVLMIFIVTR